MQGGFRLARSEEEEEEEEEVRRRSGVAGRCPGEVGGKEGSAATDLTAGAGC